MEVGVGVVTALGIAVARVEGAKGAIVRARARERVGIKIIIGVRIGVEVGVGIEAGGIAPARAQKERGRETEVVTIVPRAGVVQKGIGAGVGKAPEKEVVERVAEY